MDTSNILGLLNFDELLYTLNYNKNQLEQLNEILENINSMRTRLGMRALTREDADRIAQNSNDNPDDHKYWGATYQMTNPNIRLPIQWYKRIFGTASFGSRRGTGEIKYLRSFC